MSSDEVFVNPSVVRNGAGSLESAASALSQSWTTFCTSATSLHDPTTWGTDGPGTEFNKEYLGGDNPVGELIIGTGEMVTLAKKLGPDIKSCVDGEVEADDIVASWFPAEDA